MARRALPFANPYAHGFVRVAACTPRVRPADVGFNAAQTLELMHRAHDGGVGVCIFPELGLSGYAIDDLLQQSVLLDRVQAELAALIDASKRMRPMFVVGLPIAVDGRLFNCAATFHAGRLLGVTPKTYLPSYREFYERRWFASGAGVVGREITVGGHAAPFGVDLLFKANGPATFTAHVEICEDGWTPEPPSGKAALAGAEVLLNVSASNITLGKADTRRLLFGAQSSRCIAAYVFSASGPGESTTDLAWDGHAAVFEMGEKLAETQRFPIQSELITADVDVERLRAERIRTGSFGDGVGPTAAGAPPFRTIAFDFEPPPGDLALQRAVPRFPYVPADENALRETCYEAWNIQVQGLVERLRSTGMQRLVIGVSGGLDSTEALIVCVRAMEQLNLPRANIFAYTLPGFATSDGTKGHAWGLMRSLGVTAAEIDIRPAARQMLADMDHPFSRGEKVYDVTFENVQAGLRTDYLFRLANQKGALVVGTGDLSELGLGWCTYGVGDHMSHYNPNGSVSKTLIQHLIRFAANSGDFGAETAEILLGVLASEISPELVPQEEAGTGPQSTQAVVGPYPLQDFNLYHLTRFGMAPSKIAYLSWNAWSDAGHGAWPADIPAGDRRAHDLPEIKCWLALFLKRFFANQFKRSALPNGPKISSGGSLSPRGDWRMPSDASPAAWLDELAANTPDADPGAAPR
ncbi:NAD(+) synthase [soil metagenome]